MDFSYPPEVEQVRKELRAWLAANLTDEVIAANRGRGRDESAFQTLRTWNATMADAGWAAVSWPQEYGGRGLSLLEQLIWYEEYGRAGLPSMDSTFVGLNHAGPTLIQCATPEQKAAHLPPILRGENGLGVAGVACSSCHTEKNFTLVGTGASYKSIPGHPRWQVAPIEFAWEGKSIGQICQQIKDPNRNITWVPPEGGGGPNYPNM